MKGYIPYFMVAMLVASGAALSYVRIESGTGALTGPGVLISRKHVLTVAGRYPSKKYTKREFAYLNVRLECLNDGCGDTGQQLVSVKKAKYFRASYVAILTLSSVVNEDVPVANLNALTSWSRRKMQFTLWSINRTDGNNVKEVTYEVGRKNCKLTRNRVKSVKSMECKFQRLCGVSFYASGVLTMGTRVYGLASSFEFQPCGPASQHAGFKASLSIITNKVKRWIERIVQKDNFISWHVSIIDERTVSIGYGALIGRRHVLANAALFFKRPHKAETVDTRARIGDRVFGINKVDIHPEYVAHFSEPTNNFAILTLKEEVSPPDGLPIMVSAMTRSNANESVTRTKKDNQPMRSSNNHWLTAFVMKKYPTSTDLTLVVAEAGKCSFVRTSKVECLTPKLTCARFAGSGILTEWKTNQPKVVGVLNSIARVRCPTEHIEDANTWFSPVTTAVLQWIETTTTTS